MFICDQPQNPVSLRYTDIFNTRDIDLGDAGDIDITEWFNQTAENIEYYLDLKPKNLIQFIYYYAFGESMISVKCFALKVYSCAATHLIEDLKKMR